MASLAPLWPRGPLHKQLTAGAKGQENAMNLPNSAEVRASWLPEEAIGPVDDGEMVRMGGGNVYKCVSWAMN